MTTYYRKGDANVICDRTGFKIKKSQARKEWNNLLVRKESWEPRQPLDFPPRARSSEPVIDARPEQPMVSVGLPAGVLADSSGCAIQDSNQQFILTGAA